MPEPLYNIHEIERCLRRGLGTAVLCRGEYDLSRDLDAIGEQLRESFPTAIVSPARTGYETGPDFVIRILPETGEPTLMEEYYPLRTGGDTITLRDNGAETRFVADLSGVDRARGKLETLKRAHARRVADSRDAEPVTCPDCDHQFPCIVHYGRCPRCGCTG